MGPDTVRIIGATALTLAAELLLGVALFALGAWVLWNAPRRGPIAARHRRVSWLEASRALAIVVPYGVGLLAVAAALILAPGVPSAEPLRVWVRPLPFVLAGGLAAAGCCLMLHAGRRESAGRLRAARRATRLGGFALFFGIFAQLVLVWSDLLFNAPFRRSVLLDRTEPAMALAVAMLSLGVAAFVGVVAGLAGKPRPSAYFAGLFFLIGVVGLATAAQIG